MVHPMAHSFWNDFWVLHTYPICFGIFFGNICKQRAMLVNDDGQSKGTKPHWPMADARNCVLNYMSSPNSTTHLFENP